MMKEPDLSSEFSCLQSLSLSSRQRQSLKHKLVNDPWNNQAGRDSFKIVPDFLYYACAALGKNKCYWCADGSINKQTNKQKSCPETVFNRVVVIVVESFFLTRFKRRWHSRSRLDRETWICFDRRRRRNSSPLATTTRSSYAKVVPSAQDRFLSAH